jgi:hypothetical protein
MPGEGDASVWPEFTHQKRSGWGPLRTTLVSLHTGVRPAVEMALYEEEDRRALAGERSGFGADKFRPSREAD